MEFRISSDKSKSLLDEGKTLHVALIDADDNIEVHEKLSASAARRRFEMLKLQVELNHNIKDKPGYRAYMGEEWPPPEPEEEAES